MRELTKSETASINGGNGLILAGAVIAMEGASAFGAGLIIGESVNYFNAKVSNMSLGEAIWRATHST